MPTEFTTKVLDLFRSAYRPGTTLSKAFVYLLNVLLENSGLIFLDPNTPEVKQLLSPIFKQELTNISKSCQLVISESERLEQKYHAQVKPRSVNLFLHQPGGRFGIEPHPDGFALKGARQYFTTEELLNLLEQSPESFSPNVVLRPICQDFLLPTISYVAGPAEIAYFAQFKLLYEYFDIPEPLIYPRASLTIIEERVQKIIDKFDLKLLQVFQEHLFGGEIRFLGYQVPLVASHEGHLAGPVHLRDVPLRASERRAGDMGEPCGADPRISTHVEHDAFGGHQIL